MKFMRLYALIIGKRVISCKFCKLNNKQLPDHYMYVRCKELFLSSGLMEFAVTVLNRLYLVHIFLCTPVLDWLSCQKRKKREKKWLSCPKLAQPSHTILSCATVIFYFLLLVILAILFQHEA